MSLTSLNTWIGKGTVVSLNNSNVGDKSVSNFLLFIDEDSNTSSGKKRKVKIPIVAWAGRADYVAKNIRSGDEVRVMGSIRTRTREDDAGVRIHSWEIVAHSVLLLSRPDA